MLHGCQGTTLAFFLHKSNTLTIFFLLRYSTAMKRRQHKCQSLIGRLEKSKSQKQNSFLGFSHRRGSPQHILPKQSAYTCHMFTGFSLFLPIYYCILVISPNLLLDFDENSRFFGRILNFPCSYRFLPCIREKSPSIGNIRHKIPLIYNNCDSLSDFTIFKIHI